MICSTYSWKLKPSAFISEARPRPMPHNPDHDLTEDEARFQSFWIKHMVIVDYFVEGRCRHWENIYISLLQGVDVTCFQEEPMTNERLASMVASTSIIVIQTISSRAVKHGSETFSEDMKLKRNSLLLTVLNQVRNPGPNFARDYCNVFWPPVCDVFWTYLIT